MQQFYIFLFTLLLIQPALHAQSLDASSKTAASQPAAIAAPAAPASKADLSKSEPMSMEETLTLRDPFRRPNKFSENSTDAAIPELERYSLEQFKIIGIITGPKKAKALLSTPTNKMFIVQESDKLGNRSGIVKKIKDRSVLVREKLVNLIGQEENIETELKYLEKVSDSDAGRRL